MTMEEKKELYSNPKYYDVAFGWDQTEEIRIFKMIFEQHVPFPVKRILEPACGTGRFLVSLPPLGYEVVGYDHSGDMIAFARKRISEEGLYQKAIALIGEMQAARFAERLDAAVNPINSFAYLLSEGDIIAHLLNTSGSLKRNSVYIVQLTCMFDNLANSKISQWKLKKFGIEIETTWRIVDQLLPSKTCYHQSILKIDEKGRETVLKENHKMRLWIYDDLKHIVNATGKFALEAIYDEKGAPVSLDSHITGEMGNLYYVLKNKP
jgi:SAM-dependent methyltransferase